MAKFSYESYAAQQAAQATNANRNNKSDTEIHFLNEFLANDGDFVVVRFPYRSLADLTINSTHIMPFPNRPFGVRVSCLDQNCPMCASGNSVQMRFFLKALAYVNDQASNELRILNAIWDRPSAFADIELKGLFEEYGDISQCLFKIKRNGTGKATRYAIKIVTNTEMYPPAIYKADFTELAKIDPATYLSKTYDNYQNKLNPNKADDNASRVDSYQPTSVPPVTPERIEQNYSVAQNNFGPSGVSYAPLPNSNMSHAPEASNQTSYTNQNSEMNAPVENSEQRRPVRYNF